jgi:hypothetical protein
MERAPEARYSNFALVTSAGRQIFGNDGNGLRKARQGKESQETFRARYYIKATVVSSSEGSDSTLLTPIKITPPSKARNTLKNRSNALTPGDAVYA